MKTIAFTAAITILATVNGVHEANATDLSQTFRALKSTQHTSASAARVATPTPAVPRRLLGVWLADADGKLQVEDTVPGSPASQSLQPGDVLYSISVPGRPTRMLTTVTQFEYAKREIGAHHQVTLKVYRPGTGFIPMKVTFDADSGLATVSTPTPAIVAPTVDARGNGLVSR